MASTITNKEDEPLDMNILLHCEQTSDSERTSYKANCHCGAVRYTVTLKYPFPKYKVNRCTCSICTRNGYLLVYPRREDIVWHQGYENLSDYAFGSKTKDQKFCKTCGSSIGVDMCRNKQGELDPEKDLVAINIRMFADVDLDKMQYTFFDGKNEIGPAYSIDS